jgi:hypothetical protein
LRRTVSSVCRCEKFHLAAPGTYIQFKLLPVGQEFKQIAEHAGSGSFMELVFSGIVHFYMAPQAVDLSVFVRHLIDLNNLQVRKTVIAIPAEIKIIFYF